MGQKVKLPYDPVIAVLAIYSKELKVRIQTNNFAPMFPSSIIHNGQKVKQPVSTEGWMDKQNVVYTHNGMLFHRKGRKT